MPDVSSEYAEEGTAAHTMAALLLEAQTSDVDSVEDALRAWRLLHPAYVQAEEEVLGHVQTYLDYVGGRLDADPGAIVLVEQRLPTGIDGCWGTSDAVIVSSTSDVLEVVDLKYGQGIPVSAEGNPQLRLYALGALLAYGDLLSTVNTVRMTIVQPRAGGASSATMPADELRAWGESIRPIAAEALGGSDRFGPSEKACRFCPVAGECRARAQYVAERDWTDDILAVQPEVLSDEQLAEELARVPDTRAWLTALEATALTRALDQGRKLPGFKVVLSGQRRKIVDELGAIGKLTGELGLPLDRVAETKLLGIGKLETLLGKADMVNLLGDFITTTEGRPALVPESDRRAPLDPADKARRDFADELQD